MSEIFIPPKTRAELQAAHPEGTRHEAKIKIALPLLGSGLPVTAVEQTLIQKFPEASLTEIQSVIRWCHERATPPTGRMPIKFEPPKASTPKKTPEQICAWWMGDAKLSPEQVIETSPIIFKGTPAEETILFFEQLYQPTDKLNIVCKFTLAKDGKANPSGEGKTDTRDNWIEYFKKNGVPKSEAGAWLRMNPTKDGSGFEGAITDADVTGWRFVLLESDAVCIETQLALFQRLKLPIAAILMSGGKSAHAWLLVDCETEEKYRATAKTVLDILEPFGIDQANKNPSRLSRLPGAHRTIRAVGDGMQRLLYLNSAVPALTGADIEQLQNRISIPINEDRPMRRLILDSIPRYEELFNNRGKLGVQIGFGEFDFDTGGFKPGQVTVIAAGTNQGKAQPLEAMVLTPNGFVKMGDIRTGDFVIGSIGEKTRVVAIHPQGEKEVFKIKFSDGGETRCTADHLWLTSSLTERKNHRFPTVKTTSEILKLVQLKRKSFRLNHAIPLVGPVLFSPRGECEIHPWVLGALLGDGSLKKGGVKFTNEETDVVEKLSRLISPKDKVQKVSNRITYGISRRIRNNEPCETAKAIGRLGLNNTGSSTKFIPDSYLYASPEERLELLRGLFDTDGHVAFHRRIDYVTCSKQLAIGIKWIVFSLGGMAWVKEKQPTCEYKGKKVLGNLAYRVSVTFPNDLIPISSKKNLKKWRRAQTRRSRLVVSIVPDGKEFCQCITVEAKDGLYVTDNFIVTHNSTVALNFLNGALSNGHGVALFTLEMDREEIIDLLISNNCRVNRNCFNTGYFQTGDVEKIAAQSSLLCKLPLWIFDDASMTVSSISDRVKALKLEKKIGLVVVDYVQIITPDNAMLPREQQVAEIARGLRILAKQTKLPFIVLSQLNDEGKLRESRVVAHEAHNVIILEPNDEQTNILMKVVKGRRIRKKNYELQYEPEYARVFSSKISAEDVPKTYVD
jgi:replicative DNA helicase